jgi:hypothetical protein
MIKANKKKNINGQSSNLIIVKILSISKKYENQWGKYVTTFFNVKLKPKPSHQRFFREENEEFVL